MNVQFRIHAIKATNIQIASPHKEFGTKLCCLAVHVLSECFMMKVKIAITTSRHTNLSQVVVEAEPFQKEYAKIEKNHVRIKPSTSKANTIAKQNVKEIIFS